MKRFALLVLTTILLLGSCAADDGASAAADTTTEAATTVTETTLPQSAVPEGLDFDGAKFMLLGGDAVFEHYTMATELNGDTLNDSLFNRYQKVGNELNVEFDFLMEKASDAVNKLTSSVLAGDDSFQLAILQRATQIAAMVGSGVLYNWNDLPYVDLAGEHWYSDAIDSLRVGDLVYYTYGDIYPLSCHIFYYNKEIREAYLLDDPLDFVLDGSWTIDRMIGLSNAVSADIDGDGVLGVNDRYGMSFSSTDTINSLMYGMGIMLTERSADQVKLAECDEKRLAVFDKVHELFDSESCYKQTGQVKLINGNVLFYNGSVHGARTYRDSEIEFGILPYPKYDESQENYISFLNTELMCVPSSADTELCGATIQLLAEESGEVKTAYYEYLLKEKVARDPQSAHVLDLIFDNAINDFLISFCGGMTNTYGIYRITSTLAMSGGTDYVSQFERYREGAQAELDNAYKLIVESESVKAAK